MRFASRFLSFISRFNESLSRFSRICRVLSTFVPVIISLASVLLFLQPFIVGVMRVKIARYRECSITNSCQDFPGCLFNETNKLVETDVSRLLKYSLKILKLCSYPLYFMNFWQQIIGVSKLEVKAKQLAFKIFTTNQWNRRIFEKLE